MADDDQQRREQEMNMFAFHAAGSDTLSSLGPNSSISVKTTPTDQNPLLAAAAALEHSAAANNNNNLFEAQESAPPRSKPLVPPHEGTILEDGGVPLFSEEVWLPRPLFFGSTLPPRILSDPDPHLQAALRVLSLPRVRTFQPVWGVRAERLADHRGRTFRHKPAVVARASTAPPRISPPTVMENTILDGDNNTDSEGSVFFLEEEEGPPRMLSEKDRFSQWALMGSTADPSNMMTDGSFAYNSSSSIQRTSFQKLPGSVDSDDDGSVIEDEQRTKVGASDNLNKAIALLSGDAAVSDIALEQTQVLLSQVAPDASRKRPLTNYELTEGSVPMFGVDDSPLPQEADLGIHQTREEQLRTMELKRSHEMIEKFVPPNVLGSVSCPNPALGPDDCLSWNSRVRARTRSPPRPPKSVKRDSKRGRPMKQRFGWWNKPWDEPIDKLKNSDSDRILDRPTPPEKSNMQSPPIHHSSSAIQVVTPLEPTPEQLKEDNLPLSRMHGATTMAQALPFLSDRPSSFRYLQIDTQAVTFPPIKEDIEPFFCSIAIYNVETVTSLGGNSSKSPTPDLQRCGRVTEALHFDYVASPEVAERCSGSLWPFGGKDCGTRCGVFPIPSNLNVANLYVILIVRKVVSEESDFDPYLKPGRTWTDVAKFKSNAAKAASRNGEFVMPFAFGVAPLLQVFGVDNPVVATSRAVQIPLFHFTSGERQIIDHIMYMLHPRADHKETGVGGPASVTNGGTAMLVMRNFGYLGLHTAVDQRSSLAQNRLVDFTGELQVRRRRAHEDPPKETTESYQVRLPDWHPKFIGEPTQRGGRNAQGSEMSGSKKSKSPDDSTLYAQELAPWPLLLAPSRRLGQPGISRGRPEYDDMEPFFHTSFCNELLCHPRILHNCPKGKLIVKLELREIEWKESLNLYCAHTTDDGVGPSIHNNRRGPSLVTSSYTSCTPSRSHHHFIDEFKIKLPLRLQRKESKDRTLALFFTLYRVKLGGSAKWRNLFANGSPDPSGMSDEVVHSGRVEQVACGFLPIVHGSCLLSNGVHDVPIIYKARIPSTGLCEEHNLPSTSFVLVDKTPPEEANVSPRDDLPADKDLDNSIDTENTDMLSANEDSFSKWSRILHEPLSLSVRIMAYSSIHGQNAVMNELLYQVKEVPSLSYDHNKGFHAVLGMGRDFIISSSQLNASGSRPQPLEEKLVLPTIGVGDHSLCSASQLTLHLLRISSILWKFLVFGDGTPNLVWANPASSTSLRVHSFATLLHLVGASSLYLSKLGATQLDGETRWNVVMMGRVVALMFDESRLFGSQADELFDHEYWKRAYAKCPDEISPTSTKRPPIKRKGHVRSNYDFAQDAARANGPSAVSDIVSSAGDLATLPKPSDVDASDYFDIGGIGEKPAFVTPATKVDSKSDFMTYLRAANSEYDDVDVSTVSTTKPKDKNALYSQAASLGAFPSGGNRRYNTLPASALSTIVEMDLVDESMTSMADISDEEGSNGNHPVLMNDDFVLVGERRSKQQSVEDQPAKMRLPAISSDDQLGTLVESSEGSISVPASDDVIESMGSAYLDTIEKTLFVPNSRDGEEKRVGSKHHRKKTHGGCWSSIDWSLTGEERAAQPTAPPVEIIASSFQGGRENDDVMSTLLKEEQASARLPSFSDRLKVIGNNSSRNARWFPFAYEVIIMQWAAMLSQQERRTEKPKSNLAEASARSKGVAVAGAPMLFEVIKQSMGFRLQSFFRFLQKEDYVETPPLIILEDAMVANLEQVVARVTDACLDHNNFDSPDLRQMSIDVNNSVALFLRDLFSYMSPQSVHKLIVVYLSRFTERDKAMAVDRESLIGYRCSWEVTKLRLNAITVFARYADFIKVNGPQMLNWGSWWTTSPSRSKSSFFDEMLDKYDGFRYIQDANSNRCRSMRPHWLSEAVVDICLLGIEHADSSIQQRSSSVIFELFWSCSQESILTGISAPVSGMFLSFVEKILIRSNYIANFSPKSQLRKDLLTSLIFVLQSTPANLLRALWRRLCCRLPEKSRGSGDFLGDVEQENTADILDMFSALNLSLRTMEYEGSDESVDNESPLETKENLDLWRREYLPAKAHTVNEDAVNCASSLDDSAYYNSSISRQWQAHDGSIVIVKVANQIVREMYAILSGTPNGKSLLNPAVRNNQKPNLESNSSPTHTNGQNAPVPFSREDVVVFVRAAGSVYLHALALRQSDVVLDQTFVFSAELIKIFGIRLFLEAVGETLQHWMRVVSLQCGARRAQVRIAATDLLELVLRSTWECFGSFFRIRVPLLAVQTEVMERIVATAAARYYKEQRRKGTNFEDFSNIGAEASLVPLWRTLDRIQNNPASQNVAFKGALIRMAGKLKKLYRAYVAARALSFIRTGTKGDSEELTYSSGKEFDPDARVRAARINTLRVINASEGFTKEFLGLQGTTQNSRKVAHYEAVEDALIEAADVFSPTELPEHRVAWLRMLAEFHNSRRKVAEEATTRYFIHSTLALAARLHGTLWSNTPFLPWTDDIPDPIVYIDGDAAQAPEPDYHSDIEGNDWEYGGPVGNTNSFRRIFYRVATSVRSGNNVWDSAANQNIFFGIASGPEYYTVSPWISLREMEENMVEEVEAAGTLFLRAGIVQSSRLAWSLAAQHYTENFNYGKLAGAYGNLASAIVSRVPSIDSNRPNEVTSTLGRFYRVWFHGEAPDQLRGVEFVYRSSGGLREFGEELRSVVKSIVPQKTPVHIVLDGLSEDRDEETPQGSHSSFRIGPAQLEPVKVKVTPLRPLFGKYPKTRGLPEWFPKYVEEQYGSFSRDEPITRNLDRAHRCPSPSREGNDPNRAHQRNRSFSTTMFSSTGSFGSQAGRRRIQHENNTNHLSGKSPLKESKFVGVDKFCFVQPVNRDRRKDWWKYKDFVKYNLRVTQLQVSEQFPSCITRQKVIHRDRYDQSPLEAGIDVVCQWCSILFQTAVATTGMAVLGTNRDPGIGNDAAKIVAESLHKSRIKEIGLTMLADYAPAAGEDCSDSLPREKVHTLQLKLARLILTFVELLHLLISRNRDQLLVLMKERQKPDVSGSVHGSSIGRGYSRTLSMSGRDARENSRRSIHVPSPSEPIRQRSEEARSRQRNQPDGMRSEEARSRHQRNQSEGMRSDDARSRNTEDNHSHHSMMTATGVKTESAIAVQSELQRAFINLSRSLYNGVKKVMGDSTPAWFKQCGQETYYSMGTHKHNQMPIGSEMCFQANQVVPRETGISHQFLRNPSSFFSEHGCDSPRGSVGGSQRSHNSVTSRNSERFGSVHQM